MKVVLKLAAALALLSLGACAQFYSETPILTGADSVPAYGTDIGRIELISAPDSKPVKMRSVWRDGAYVHTATERDKGLSFKTYQVVETLAASSAAAGSFISQRAMEKEGGGGVIYYYDLIKPVGDTFVTYDMTCSDLSRDERAHFNMIPPMPEAPPETAAPPATASTPSSPAPPPPGPAAETAAGPAAEPTLGPKEPTDCLVRTRADLEAAFAAIAGRKEPMGVLKVKPKRRGLFGG